MTGERLVRVDGGVDDVAQVDGLLCHGQPAGGQRDDVPHVGGETLESLGVVLDQREFALTRCPDLGIGKKALGLFSDDGGPGVEAVGDRAEQSGPRGFEGFEGFLLGGLFASHLPFVRCRPPSGEADGDGGRDGQPDADRLGEFELAKRGVDPGCFGDEKDDRKDDEEGGPHVRRGVSPRMVDACDDKYRAARTRPGEPVNGDTLIVEQPLRPWMAERTEEERIRRARVGAVIIASVLVLGGAAFVLGTAVGNGSDAGTGDRSSDEGSCPADTSRHPISDACVPNAEVCNAWLDGSANEAVQCTAESTDGRVLLRIFVQGSGSALVQASDGNGLKHDQRYFFSDSRELELSGLRGEWMLRVVFEDAKGSARITLWG